MACVKSACPNTNNRTTTRRKATKTRPGERPDSEHYTPAELERLRENGQDQPRVEAAVDEHTADYEELMEQWARHLFNCWVETEPFEPLVVEEQQGPSPN